MRALKAFTLGTIAVAVLAYAAAAAGAVTAQASNRSLHLGLGPLVVLSVENHGTAAVTTFGPGIVAVSLVGGLANLGAALLIRRRAYPRGNCVD